MDNVEKRLYAKLQRQITVEKERKERILTKNKKRIETGTKKIYYTILKEIIKNKSEEDITIEFNEFIDSVNNIPFLFSISVNRVKIKLGKTYFNFDKFKNYLDYFCFSIHERKDINYHIEHLEIREKLCFLNEITNGYVTVDGISTELIGKRSIVCDCLLKIDPNQIVIKPNIPIEDSKIYTKQ